MQAHARGAELHMDETLEILQISLFHACLWIYTHTYIHTYIHICRHTPVELQSFHMDEMLEIFKRENERKNETEQVCRQCYAYVLGMYVHRVHYIDIHVHPCIVHVHVDTHACIV